VVSNLFSADDGCEAAVEVECVPLDELLADAGPIHVIKLDVEGAEVSALRGAQRLITESPELTLFCELNPTALRRAGVTPAELLHTLGDLGFQARAIDERLRKLVPVEEARFHRSYVDLLAKRAPGHRAS